MIRIKRIYDALSEEDGYRVLVDRLWPRGLKKENARVDQWLKELAPSNELRQWFAHEPERWDEFQQKYRKELAGMDDLVQPLRKKARIGTVTLLFAAKDEEHNNAVVLREHIDHRPVSPRRHKGTKAKAGRNL